MSRHIIVCCDGTGSMRTYFKAIHNVLPQVITMLQPIYGADINLHIAVYHDYDNKSPRHERGGYAISYDGTVESCKQFANDNCTKVAGGGGDGPEATLTAFVYIYDFISDLDGDVLIIHCTDQAPHGFMRKRVNNRLVGEYNGRDKVYYQAEVDHLHPVVLQSIYKVQTAAKQYNTPLSICGMIAADDKALGILIGLGIRHLSMSKNKLAKIKASIRQLNAKHCEEIAQQALLLEDAKQVRKLVEENLILSIV